MLPKSKKQCVQSANARDIEHATVRSEDRMIRLIDTLTSIFLLAVIALIVTLTVWAIVGIMTLPSHDWDLKCAMHAAYMQAHEELGTGLEQDASPYYLECMKYA